MCFLFQDSSQNIVVEFLKVGYRQFVIFDAIPGLPENPADFFVSGSLYQSGNLFLFQFVVHWDQLNEDRIRFLNRLHREMKIYFPEYKDAFGKFDGAFSLEVLRKAPFPEDLIELGRDGIKQIWHDAKLRGRGYSKAEGILKYAGESVGIKDGADVSRIARIVANEMNEGKGSPIEIDGASNNGVDNIREIIDSCKFQSLDSKYKIFILDEVHMLSIGAFNALLKTLEEPPANTIFILCTTDPQKIPATILSRVQRFQFTRIPTDSIVQRLIYILEKEQQEMPEGTTIIAWTAFANPNNSV